MTLLSTTPKLLLASLTLLAGCLDVDSPVTEETTSEVVITRANLMRACDRDFVVKDPKGTMALLYCATGPLQPQGSGPPPSYPNYHRLVIAQHGRGGDARKYFETTTNLAADYPGTFVFAPQLLNLSEPKNNGYDGVYGFVPGWHFQWGSKWAIGGLSSSADNAPFTRSSFELYDELITTALAVLPNVREVVLVGHSAGGQLVNRYAASNLLKFPPGVNVRYIPMNPQSWLYLDGKRPFPEAALDGGTIGMGGQPPIDLPSVCPDYNHYWTGLEKLDDWNYFAKRGIKAATIIGQFKSRKVINMVGQKDTGDPDPELDCRFVVQGKNRNERAKKYYEHVMSFYAPFAANHLLFEVPNVGHSHVNMFGSECGRRWIFDDFAQPCN